MTLLHRAPWKQRLYRTVLSPRAIVVAAALVLCSVLALQYAEHRRARRDVLRVMQSTADTLARTLAASGEQATHAMRNTEQAVLDQLMLKLRVVAELARAGKLDQSAASAYAAATGLDLLAFDTAGALRLAALHHAPYLTNSPAAWRAALAPLYAAADGDLRVDVRAITGTTIYWRAVALRTPASVLALVPPPEQFSFRYSIGPGATLQRLATLPDLRYIVWQDDDGVIAAGGDFDAALAARADGDHRAIHEFTVPASLSFGAASGGVFRVGISADDLRRIERQSLWRLVLTACVLSVLTALMLQLAALRRRVERERAHSQHLASVGQLAAGVAHEVRNPLNAVALTLQQLLSDTRLVQSDPDNATLLTLAGDEIKRANATLTHFLEYARPPALVCRPASVVAVCENVCRMLAATAARQHVTFMHDFQPVPDVPLDAGQFQQAVMNLAINALEAMPDGGELLVATAARRASVELRVCDTGPGIPPAARARVFDLYYTTKHKGFGLGLPFVLRCVTMHGGSVTIAAHRPHGTCVSIILPCAGSAPPSTTHA